MHAEHYISSEFFFCTLEHSIEKKIEVIKKWVKKLYMLIMIPIYLFLKSRLQLVEKMVIS
jgi:hypothetical protein